MTRHLVTVDDHGGHVHVDMSRLPSHVWPLFLGAISTYSGQNLLMAKATKDDGEGPDPRYPDFNMLVDRFRATWSRWANWLADRVIGALRGDEPARDVAEALRHHDAGVTAETTGAVLDPTTHRHLVETGMVRPDAATTAPIPAAALLGMARDPNVPHRIPAPGAPPPTPPTNLSPQQLGALAYVRDRAAIFMSRPISALHIAVRTTALDAGVGIDPRRLTDAERAIVGNVIAQGVTRRLPTAKVAQMLRDAAQGTSLTNDMDRVARTEMAFAHNHGALVTLKGKLPPGADPTVYKIVSPGACDECRRIWGPSANPRHYKLSVVDAGNNFRKPPHEWGPSVGPIHPACLCPPLLRWDPAVHDAVQDVAEELRKLYDGKPRLRHPPK